MRASNYKLKKNRGAMRGFTFIDLLMAAAIIATLSAAAAVSYKRATERTQVKNAAREIEAAVKLSQGLAVTGRCSETQVVDNNCTLPCGYGFRVDNAYALVVYYNDPGPADDCGSVPNGYQGLPTSKIKETFGLDKVKITSLTGTGVYYNTPHVKPFNNNGTIMPFNGFVTIEIEHKQQSSIKRRITVRGNGGVAVTIP